MKKAILFDLDGTLWDSGDTVLPAWNRVLAEVQVRPLLTKEELDTMFFTTSLEYAYLSSTTVREIASFGGDISGCVPDFVEKLIYEKYGLEK